MCVGIFDLTCISGAGERVLAPASFLKERESTGLMEKTNAKFS